MDVREKLVDLIFKSLCRHIDKSCKLAENIADDLLCNGVTVQDFGLVNDMNNGERCNFENNHDAICGSTNLPCIKCNPGGCNNRKEGTDNG